MNRRSFLERTCTAGAASLPMATLPASAAQARPRAYARTLLVDAIGQPLRASQLRPHVNYLFHYPYASTPVFLLNLGRALEGHSLSAGGGSAVYHWPGGAGPRRSVVAYCAICPYNLVHPSAEISLISYRPDRARRGVQNGLIHCCADQCQFDPAHGAAVLAGPAHQPLAAVLLSHDPARDTLTAYGTLGAPLFDPFFARFEGQLKARAGAGTRVPVSAQARVWELSAYCPNTVQC
ncbi:MAG: (2Fe-2S)-binding protein [Pseudomonadota bacterium]